jgi:hypothetical protein
VGAYLLGVPAGDLEVDPETAAGLLGSGLYVVIEEDVNDVADETT